MKCRFCKNTLKNEFLDLGSSPISNHFLLATELDQKEKIYPLQVFVCDHCWLVQLGEFESPQKIFSNHYPYFSSFSDSWLHHSKDYTVKMIKKIKLNQKSHVVEIGSNDGYLLQYFKNKKIPVLGIEPAGNVAQAAIDKGIPTEKKFFGVKLAKELTSQGIKADLLIGNNVLAHVPDLNDFIDGMKILLKTDGIITLEFPHLLNLINEVQFDTIYHEHFSYISLSTATKIFQAHGLSIFDVDEILTHGGSLRIYIKHQENNSKQVESKVKSLIQKEMDAGLNQIEIYKNFQERVKQLKNEILSVFREFKKMNKIVVGYGAPAKGNTLLNYCRIKSDLISYTVDKNPEKQGCYLPGSHIPVESPDKIKETKPDFLFILPWNIKEEVMEQMGFIRDWGGKFLIAIPRVEILD